MNDLSAFFNPKAHTIFLSMKLIIINCKKANQ